MTDADIMKALECCSASNQRCYGCPLHMDCMSGVPSRNIARAALELIDAQQKRIERLKKHNLLCAQLHYNDGREDLTKKIVEKLDEMKAKPMELVYDVPLIQSIIEIVKGECYE